MAGCGLVLRAARKARGRLKHTARAVPATLMVRVSRRGFHQVRSSVKSGGSISLTRSSMEGAPSRRRAKSSRPVALKASRTASSRAAASPKARTRRRRSWRRMASKARSTTALLGEAGEIQLQDAAQLADAVVVPVLDRCEALGLQGFQHGRILQLVKGAADFFLQLGSQPTLQGPWVVGEGLAGLEHFHFGGVDDLF